jgi:hypothetical protein
LAFRIPEKYLSEKHPILVMLKSVAFDRTQDRFCDKAISVVTWWIALAKKYLILMIFAFKNKCFNSL